MFLRNIALQERAIAADIIESYDIGVNPLSVILLCLRPLNETSTITTFKSYLDICAALNKVSVLYRGEAIVSMRGEDLAAMNYFRHGLMPFQGMNLDTDNFRRCCILPIPMGRFMYDGSTCFPATRRGELILEADWDVADTGYDGMRFSMETIELPGASPTEYEKRVQIAQTNGSTGDTDMDLPATGNLIRGVLLFGTTGFTGAAPAPSWGRLKLLLDNVEAGYSNCDWETLQMEHSLLGRTTPSYDAHQHRVDATAAVATQQTIAGTMSEVGRGGWEKYAFMNLDPTWDDQHSLVTSGKSRLLIRANIETADAVRAIPIEVIKL